MSFFGSLFGSRTDSLLRELRPLGERVNALEPDIHALSDGALRAKTADFKARLSTGLTLDDLLPEAFAVAREAALRTLGQRHYDVQILGGVVLHRGSIAEMKTGEGKTLVATLPAYLNALAGKGVHVVTVNDYLSRRDAVWMGQIYNFLGLSVGVLNHEASYLYDPAHTTNAEDAERDTTGSFRVVHEFLRPCPRREAYAADLTYGTNHEYGFDYLRDNLAYAESALVARPPAYAIVDEIDSILIDEARTPLIISAPVAEPEKLYKTFTDIARALSPEEHYTLDRKLKAVSLTDLGIDRAEALLGVRDIYTDRGIKYVHHLETALRAKEFYARDKEYVIRPAPDDGGEVVIVDEFTGRLQPGRRWSEGLHQAIESKEGVRVREESRTLASVTFQNYFRLYPKLCGMTGTALTSAEEFLKVYGLEVVPIPTHRPNQRKDWNDLIYQTEMGKFAAVAQKVKALHEKGQPVLVGTISIEKNELLSALLRKEGVPHQILNAKNHEQEGMVIAQAGKRGAVTIATNMAGRGVDILLGGNPASPVEADEVRAGGGLAVIGTERHEARRIDNQLRGRAGRQGDPGETHFFASLEDSLMRVFASESIKKMMGHFGIPEDEPIENRLVTKAIESAQEKIEGLNFDARKHVLEYDDVLNHQRVTIYARRRATLADANLSPEERQLRLQVMDLLWMEHLEAMEYLRQSVRLRAYGQRDPLVEYKREGLRLFKDLEASIETQAERLREHVKSVRPSPPPTEFSPSPSSGGQAGASVEAGRNDLCPCGSGKKYKKCGLMRTPEHQARMAS